MGTSLGDLYIPVRAALKDFGPDVERAATQAGQNAGAKFGDIFSATAQKRALKAGAAITGALAAGMAQLDSAARSYQAAVGASADETERAKAAALALFKVNTAGFDDILGLMAKLRTDQGLSEEQTNRLAQAYLNWSKVAGGTATNAAKAFDDVQDAWNLTAEDSVGLMDKLVAANQKYGGSLQARIQDLSTLAPALKGLGLTIDDAIALENAFEAAGLDASQAQRALTKAISELKPGQTFNDLVTQVSAIEDPTSRAQKAIEIFGARGAGLANVFKPGTTSLAEFGISADEAAGKVSTAAKNIDSSVPKQFELFLRNLTGTLMEFAGSGGPILLTIASVAQLVGSLGGLNVAFQALKLSATEGWLAVLGPVALLAIALPALKTVFDEASAAGHKLAAEGGGGFDSARAKAAEYTRQVAILKQAYDSGALSATKYDAELAKLKAAYGDVTTAADSNAGSTVGLVGTVQSLIQVIADAVAAHHAAAAATATHTQTIAGLVLIEGELVDQQGGVISSTAELRTQLAATYGITINEGEAALFLARGMNAAAIAAQQAAAGIAAFRAGHPTNLNLPRGTADTQVQFNPGSINTTDQAFDPDALRQHNIGLGANFGYVAPKKGRAGRGSDAAAKALAKAIHEEVVNAYERMQVAGEAALDSIHAKEVRAIDDAHNVARNKIDADHRAAQNAIEEAHREASERITSARRAVDAQLTQQQRLNAAPVTAAEQALRSDQNRRQLRDLTEQLRAAEAGTDPKALRSAQEALADFLAQQNIDALREQQAQADEQARATAQAAQDSLDAQQKMLDKVNEDRLAAEDVAYQAKVDAEDKAYKLRQHDEDVRADRAKKALDDHVVAMENSKDATVKLAEAETKRYLQEQIKLAREALAEGTGTQKDLKVAMDELADFLKSIKKHAAGGWVGLNGAELGIYGENEPEFVAPQSQLARMFQPAAYGTPRMAAGVSAYARSSAGGGMGDASERVAFYQTVHYPAPEPPSTSARRELQLLAATGILG